jgi:hypothetical protein
MATFIISDPAHTEGGSAVMLNVDHIRQIEITDVEYLGAHVYAVRAITTYGPGIDLYSSPVKTDAEKVYAAVGERIPRAQQRGDVVRMADLVRSAPPRRSGGNDASIPEEARA